MFCWRVATFSGLSYFFPVVERKDHQYKSLFSGDEVEKVKEENTFYPLKLIYRKLSEVILFLRITLILCFSITWVGTRPYFCHHKVVIKWTFFHFVFGLMKCFQSFVKRHPIYHGILYHHVIKWGTNWKLMSLTYWTKFVFVPPYYITVYMLQFSLCWGRFPDKRK